MKLLSKIIMIFVLIAIGTFSFYWFSFRPSYIRKQCNKEAHNVFDKSGEIKGTAVIDTYLNAREQKYLDCVRSKGLEK